MASNERLTVRDKNEKPRGSRQTQSLDPPLKKLKSSYPPEASFMGTESKKNISDKENSDPKTNNTKSGKKKSTITIVPLKQLIQENEKENDKEIIMQDCSSQESIPSVYPKNGPPKNIIQMSPIIKKSEERETVEFNNFIASNDQSLLKEADHKKANVNVTKQKLNDGASTPLFNKPSTTKATSEFKVRQSKLLTKLNSSFAADDSESMKNSSVIRLKLDMALASKHQRVNGPVVLPDLIGENPFAEEITYSVDNFSSMGEFLSNYKLTIPASSINADKASHVLDYSNLIDREQQNTFISLPGHKWKDSNQTINAFYKSLVGPGDLMLLNNNPGLTKALSELKIDAGLVRAITDPTNYGKLISSLWYYIELHTTFQAEYLSDLFFEADDYLFVPFFRHVSVDETVANYIKANVYDKLTHLLMDNTRTYINFYYVQSLLNHLLYEIGSKYLKINGANQQELFLHMCAAYQQMSLMYFQNRNKLTMLRIGINVLNEGIKVAISSAKADRELAEKSIEMANKVQKKYDIITAKYGSMLENSGLRVLEFKNPNSISKLEIEVNNDLLSYISKKHK